MDFQHASDSNWDLLVELFSKENSKFKLIKPSTINSVFDGILTCKKDGREIVILVEVKRRQFSSEVLRTEYNSTLFLEKDKYTYLHKRATELAKVPGRELKIWYLSKTDDGVCYIHDIYNKDFLWVATTMNKVTYAANGTPEKTKKYVALLHTSDSLYTLKTNIIK
jgi:hypothetical protein